MRLRIECQRVMVPLISFQNTAQIPSEEMTTFRGTSHRQIQSIQILVNIHLDGLRGGMREFK